MENSSNLLLISHLPPPATGIGSWTKRVLEIGLPDNWNVFIVNSNTINGRDPFRSTKRSIKDEYKGTKTIPRKIFPQWKANCGGVYTNRF